MDRVVGKTGCPHGVASLHVVMSTWISPVKFLPTATTPKKPLKQKTRWNGLRCAYMMVTFLFVSYNKGDWVGGAGFLKVEREEESVGARRKGGRSRVPRGGGGG